MGGVQPIWALTARLLSRLAPAPHEYNRVGKAGLGAASHNPQGRITAARKGPPCLAAWATASLAASGYTTFRSMATNHDMGLRSIPPFQPPSPGA